MVISFDDSWKMLELAAARDRYPFYWAHYFLTEAANMGEHMQKEIPGRGLSLISLKALMQTADAIIPATPQSLKVAQQWKLQNAIQSHILPFLLDERDFKFSRKRRKEMRKGMNVGDKDFLFVLVARNFARKNLPLAIKAFAHALHSSSAMNKKTSMVLYIHTVPTNPLGWDVRYLVNEAGIGDRVMIRDMENYSDEADDDFMVSLYSAADCAINSSYGEGLGYPILEAMLSECPVIVPGQGFLSSFVPEKNNRIINIGTDFYPYGSGFSQKWFACDAEAYGSSMLNLAMTGQKRNRQNRKQVLKSFDSRTLYHSWQTLVSTIYKNIQTKGLLL